MRETTTPKLFAEDVRRFCDRIAPGEEPVFLADALTDEGERPCECFENAHFRTQRFGGEVVLGWTIWEWPEVLVEAEFHAVWRNPKGVLVDVTPRLDGEARVFFLRDPKSRYEGLRVDNLRMAILDHPAVHDFIAAGAEAFAVKFRGERAFQKQFKVPQHEIAPILEKMHKAQARIREVLRTQNKDSPTRRYRQPQ